MLKINLFKKKYHVMAITICRMQSPAGGGWLFVLHTKPWQADYFQHIVSVVQGWESCNMPRALERVSSQQLVPTFCLRFGWSLSSFVYLRFLVHCNTVCPECLLSRPMCPITSSWIFSCSVVPWWLLHSNLGHLRLLIWRLESAEWP